MNLHNLIYSVLVLTTLVCQVRSQKERGSPKHDAEVVVASASSDNPVANATARQLNETLTTEESDIMTLKGENVAVPTEMISQPPVNKEDPALSKSCQMCTCSLNTSPFVIDCTDKNMSEMFLDTDWPRNTLITAIDAEFNSNQFNEILQFPQLPIIRLSFRVNGVRAIQKATFRNLTLLQELDLSGNDLTQLSLFREVFQGPYSNEDYEPIPLKILLLGYNSIHSINMDAFDHTPHLEKLELNNNPLAIIDRPTEMAISSLRKLQFLNLAEANLETLPEGFLHALKGSLKVLILSGNQFTTIPAELHRATTLQYLNLNNNPIARLDSESFRGLESLKRLNISSMPSLESIGDFTFTPLKSMTTMWCSFNPKLNHIHLKAFAELANQSDFIFSEFHFRGNAVSTLPSLLLPWDSIDVIDIEENPWVCDCDSGWIILNLYPIIEDKTPDLTMSLICSAPPEYKDRPLGSLENEFQQPVEAWYQNCTKGQDSDGSSHDRPPTYSTSSFNVSLMFISLFGILMVVIGVGIMGVMAVKKRHLREMYDQTSGQIVHYIRTPNKTARDDEEAIIQRNSVYNDEP